MPDEPGFEVEFHVAGQPVRFTVTADYLKNHPHPFVSAEARKGGRENLWAALMTTLEWVFDEDRRSPVDPIQVIDDDQALWMIDPRAILAVRVFDRAEHPAREVGFISRDSATVETPDA